MKVTLLIVCSISFSVWAFCNHIFATKASESESTLLPAIFASVVPLIASIVVAIYLSLKISGGDQALLSGSLISTVLSRMPVLVVAGIALGVSYILYANLVQDSSINAVLILIGNLIFVFSLFRLFSYSDDGLALQIQTIKPREFLGVSLLVVGIAILKY